MSSLPVVCVQLASVHAEIMGERHTLERMVRLYQSENLILTRMVNGAVLHPYETDPDSRHLLETINRKWRKELEASALAVQDKVAKVLGCKTEELMKGIGCELKEQMIQIMIRSQSGSTISRPEPVNVQNLFNKNRIASPTISGNTLRENKNSCVTDPIAEDDDGNAQFFKDGKNPSSLDAIRVHRHSIDNESFASKKTLVSRESFDFSANETFKMVKINRFSFNSTHHLEINVKFKCLFIKDSNDNVKHEVNKDTFVRCAAGDESGNTSSDPLLLTIWYRAQKGSEVLAKSYQSASPEQLRRFLAIMDRIVANAYQTKVTPVMMDELKTRIMGVNVLGTGILRRAPQPALSPTAFLKPPIRDTLDLKEDGKSELNVGLRPVAYPSPPTIQHSRNVSAVQIQQPPPPLIIPEKKIPMVNGAPLLMSWTPQPIKMKDVILDRELIDIIYEVGALLSQSWTVNSSKSVYGFTTMLEDIPRIRHPSIHSYLNATSRAASDFLSFTAMERHSANQAPNLSKLPRIIAEELFKFIIWLDFSISIAPSPVTYDEAIKSPSLQDLHAKLAYQLNETFCDFYCKTTPNFTAKTAVPQFAPFDELNDVSKSVFQQDITEMLRFLYVAGYQIVPNISNMEASAATLKSIVCCLSAQDWKLACALMGKYEEGYASVQTIPPLLLSTLLKAIPKASVALSEKIVSVFGSDAVEAAVSIMDASNKKKQLVAAVEANAVIGPNPLPEILAEQGTIGRSASIPIFNAFSNTITRNSLSSQNFPSLTPPPPRLKNFRTISSAVSSPLESPTLKNLNGIVPDRARAFSSELSLAVSRHVAMPTSIDTLQGVGNEKQLKNLSSAPATPVSLKSVYNFSLSSPVTPTSNMTSRAAINLPITPSSVSLPQQKLNLRSPGAITASGNVSNYFASPSSRQVGQTSSLPSGPLTTRSAANSLSVSESKVSFFQYPVGRNAANSEVLTSRVPPLINTTKSFDSTGRSSTVTEEESVRPHVVSPVSKPSGWVPPRPPGPPPSRASVDSISPVADAGIKNAEDRSRIATISYASISSAITAASIPGRVSIVPSRAPPPVPALRSQSLPMSPLSMNGVKTPSLAMPTIAPPPIPQTLLLEADNPPPVPMRPISLARGALQTSYKNE